MSTYVIYMETVMTNMHDHIQIVDREDLLRVCLMWYSGAPAYLFEEVCTYGNTGNVVSIVTTLLFESIIEIQCRCTVISIVGNNSW